MSRAQAAADAAAQQRDARRKIGAMAAGYGASGVDPGQGSPLDILSDAAEQSMLDAQNITYKGEVRAIGYSNAAANDRAAASRASTAGFVNAASSLIMGGAGLFHDYPNFFGGGGNDFASVYGTAGNSIGV